MLLVSAFFALLLFEGAQREEIFPDYGEAIYNLLVLLTTSNYPDVMMPVRRRQRLRKRLAVDYFVVRDRQWLHEILDHD